MGSISPNVQEAGASLSKMERLKAMHDLHAQAYSMEDEEDTVNRYSYYHLQTAVIMTGFHLGLFKTLAASTDKSMSLDHLQQKTGADKALLARLLTYLSAIHAVDEVERNHYAANNSTRNLATDMTKAGISHCFETVGPMFHTLPAFLKKTNYKNPDDSMHTVFQDAWNDPRHVFSWFSDHPDKLAHFNKYMALRRDVKQSWLGLYPVAEKTADWDPERPVFVDVGGSIGHQCAHFKQAFPDIPGRVILQDLEHSIANALPTPGVEKMVHDFFRPQPVLGARFYYLRAILHDHPDSRVSDILGHIKTAMTDDSILLLDEMVLPEMGVNSYAAAIDLTMMVATAAHERTEAQWHKVIDGAGLKLVKTYCYNPASYETILEVFLP